MKVAVTAVVLAYLAAKLDFGQLFSKLASVDLLFFLGAVLALAGPIALTSLRWQLILRAQRIMVPYRAAVSYDLVGLFFNAFLPGSTGGDAVRVYFAIARFPTEKARIIASIVVDRGTGLLVILCFGYGAFVADPALLSHLPFARAAAIYLPPVLGLLFASLAVFLFLPSRRVPGTVRRWVDAALERGIIGRLVLFLKQQRRRPWIFVIALAISIVSYLLNFFSAYLIAHAMGLEISYLQIIFMISILYTIISLPISFGGHGLREVVLIGLFAALGFTSAGAEGAVAYSLLLFSVQLIWSLIGGAWFLFHRHRPVIAPTGDNEHSDIAAR